MVNSFIDRIQEINPVLNCVVADRFDDARKDAQKVDEIIKNGTIPRDVLEREKPFFGVPFTTKDCIAVKGKKQVLFAFFNVLMKVVRFVSVLDCFGSV